MPYQQREEREGWRAGAWPVLARQPRLRTPGLARELSPDHVQVFCGVIWPGRAQNGSVVGILPLRSLKRATFVL
jgi:hypothetical protein